MSVVIVREDRPPEEVLAGHEGFGLVELNAAELVAMGLLVQRDPQPEEQDHAVVIGPKPQSVRRRMAKNCRWVIKPPSP